MDSPFAGPLILKCSLSVFSMIGSGYIIQHVLRSPTRRSKVFTRLMLGMSIHDFIFAVWNITGPWQLPSETPWPWAMGNWDSCVGLAFLGRGGLVASFLYNGNLALYYLLTIRYGWKEQRLRTIEVYMHAVALGIGWSIAIAGAALKLYNPLALGCAITGFPLGCQSRGNCQRGEHAAEYAIAFVYMWWWLVLLWIVIAMTMIYLFVAQTEQTGHRFRMQTVLNRKSYSGGAGSSSVSDRIPAHSSAASDSTGTQRTRRLSNESRRQRQSSSSNNNKANVRRRFMNQAILYCLSFFIAFVFTAIHMIIIRVRGSLILQLTYLSSSLASLTGFFNAFIYIRPRYLLHRQQQRQQEARQNNDNDLHANEPNQRPTRSIWNLGRSPAPRPPSRVSAFLQAVSIHADDDHDLADSAITDPFEEEDGPGLSAVVAIGVAEEGELEVHESNDPAV